MEPYFSSHYVPSWFAQKQFYCSFYFYCTCSFCLKPKSFIFSCFRSQLVSHAYSLYFREQTYYRVANLDGRIENADHRLTDDITAFTSSIAHLYSHITKPLFDCLLIAIALARTNKKMGAAIIPGKQMNAPYNILHFINEFTVWG